MFTGNGAYVIHKALAKNISGYELISLPPRLQYLPVVLPFSINRSADIIHTTPDYATFFRSHCKKLFLTFQNFVLDDEMQNYSNVVQRIHYRLDLKWFTSRAVRQADVITSVSRSTAELVRKTLDYSGEMQIIYNGVDTGIFLPDERRKRIRECKILFAGNLTRRKGAHLLNEIAEKLNPGCIIYYTNGLNPRNNLPAHARLRALGAIRHEEIPELYRDMDILLFPSFREGFSVAVLEAMASALPVVTSNCSSMPEQIIDGRGGFLCEPGNTDDFAAKLNLLAESPDTCRNMGQFNRDRVTANFSLSKMISGYNSIFEKLAG